MICKNCGKELQDGVKFCAFCGTRVEEPVAAEPDVVTDNTDAPIETTSVTVKKKSGFLKWLIIAVVAVVAAVGITVAAAFPYVKNFVAKTILPAEKYYQSVENKNIDKTLDNVIALFDSVKESSKTLKKNYASLGQGNLSDMGGELDGKNVKTELSLTLGDSVVSVSGNMGISPDVFKRIALSIDEASLDGLSSSNVSLKLSDKDVISINAVVDEKGVAYVSYPDMTDTAMKMDLSQLMGVEDIENLTSSAEVSSVYGVLFDVIDALPDGETAAKIISKYADAALSKIDDAKKSKEELSVGDVEVNATAVEVTLDEKTTKKLILTLIEEFRDDEELTSIIDDLVAASGYAERGETKKNLESSEFFDHADEMLEETLDGLGEMVSTIFVDAKGDTLGRKIEYEDTTLSVICLEKGDDKAFEISLDSSGISFSLVGEGIVKKNIFNGVVTIKAMGQSIVTVDVESFDIEKPMNGTITIKPSKTISSLLATYETDDIEEALGVSLEKIGIDLEKLSVVLDMKSDDKSSSFSLDLLSGNTSVIRLGVSSVIEDAKSITIPEKSMEISSEEDLAAWSSTLDVEGYIASLPTELQVIAQLISESGMFSENSGSSDDYYYEDDFNYEDYVSDAGLAETLDIATSPDFPPFAYYDGGYISGIDVDLGKSIANYFGMNHAIYSVEFDEIVPSVAEGAFDIGIAAITATEERLIDVNFSIPYITNTQVVIMREDSPLKYLTDLYEKGAKHIVGVKANSTAQSYATSDFGSERVVSYDEYENTLEGLLGGQVDYIIVDYPVAKLFLENNTGIKRLEEDFSYEEYCIVVAKENEALLQMINEAIELFQQDGSLQFIYESRILGYMDPGEEIPEFDIDSDYYRAELIQGVLEGLLSGSYDYDTGSTDSAASFGNGIDFDGIYDNFGYETTPSYTAPQEKVMDDYYYNDYYYGRQHTEDYFDDYGY